MSLQVLFGVFVLATSIALWAKSRSQEVARVNSSIDDRSYLVLHLPDRQQAADLLARINQACGKLTTHLAAKHGDKPCVHRLRNKYRAEALSEGSPDNGYAGVTSYSINKGEKIVVCLRQPESNAFVELNVLLYVVFHELAHLMTLSIGHTPEFWDNFKFMLKEAVDAGLYTRVDYAKQNEEYCGIVIKQSVI